MIVWIGSRSGMKLDHSRPFHPHLGLDWSHTYEHLESNQTGWEQDLLIWMDDPCLQSIPTGKRSQGTERDHISRYRTKPDPPFFVCGTPLFIVPDGRSET
jgi:hypothetical protein